MPQNKTNMKNYKNVKLIVTDMDGTLLHSDYTLNPLFFDIYNQIKTLGISFAVASGRQYESLFNIFKEIQNDIYFIAENGGNVVYQGKQQFVQEIDPKIIKEVVKIIRLIPNTELILCGVKSAYIEESKPEFEEHIAPYYPLRELVSDFLKPINDQIVKIAIYNPESSEDNIFPHVGYLKDKFQVVISGKHWVDISVENSNKGYALKKIQNILQVSKEETMVFGDYLNDIEMMSNGYYSFAMDNAHPLLKEKARFLASSNDEDGVLKILKDIIEQKNK